ncbi:hypothetical protein KKA69_00820, partial [Patescibacteria group bacterium]|nr:hypothetical protein [Patescibacteria group bacterium]
MNRMDYHEETKRRQCKCRGYLIPFAQYSDGERVKDWSGEHWEEVPIPFRLCSRCLKLEKIRLGEHPGIWTIAEGA